MEKEFKYKLGKKVAYIRSEYKLTREELSDKTGIDVQKIYRIEKGDSSMTVDELYRFAMAMNISIDSLLGIDNQKSGVNSLEKNLVVKRINELYSIVNGKSKPEID